MLVPPGQFLTTDTLLVGSHTTLFLEAGAVIRSTADRAVVLGRGPGLGIAGEVALKLQETCGVFAFPYSGAEVLHGPAAMLTDRTPVIALTGGAELGLAQACETLASRGVPVQEVSAGTEPSHPMIDPLLVLPPLYLAIERAARARGNSPDAPRHLQKETVTR